MSAKTESPPGAPNSSTAPCESGCYELNKTNGNFNYSIKGSCGLQVATEVNRLHSKILDAARTCLDDAVTIGELLNAQKAALGHGQWLPWLKANVQFSRQSADNYRRVYDLKVQGKLLSVSNLSDAYRLLAPTKAAPVEKPESKCQNVRYHWHPYSVLNPWAGDGSRKSREREINCLTDSLKKNGLYVPITLYDGEILDGRNRYIACCKANVAARYEEFTGDDPLDFLFSKNLPRYNEGQRAIIAVELYSEYYPLIEFINSIERFSEAEKKNAIYAIIQEMRDKRGSNWQEIIEGWAVDAGGAE
jgi:hypothetical protein